MDGRVACRAVDGWTAFHCDAVHCDAVERRAVHCDAIHCDTVDRCAVQCDAVTIGKFRNFVFCLNVLIQGQKTRGPIFFASDGIY